MASIDVGSPAISRGSYAGATNTIILKENPVNAAGTINSVEIGVYAALVGCKIATFYSTGTDQFSTRAYVTLGNIASGIPQTFTGLSLACEVGDYIGIYYSDGMLVCDVTGLGSWYVTSVDKIPCVTMNFVSQLDRTISLYATGVTYPPPTAPSSAHTDSKTTTQIVMHWTDNSSNETGFKMYKNDTLITTIAAGSVSYTFTGLTAGTQYDLAVKATNTYGDSAEAQLTETTLIPVPNLKPRVDGALKTYSDGWVRIDGGLRHITDMWTKTDGVLKKL